ncbi:MAG: MotA/TolQ/ExbB proton channel family protein [Verrucomicrobiae bacterium]|nr:MotA/TolQ/ExbB proton channel family protein [Verrucomicrobiae bacterium]
MLELIQEAIGIWRAGGWAMYGLTLNAMLLFGLATAIWLRLQSKGYRSVPESTWRQWLQQPAQRRGAIGRLLDSLTGVRSLEELSVRFQELRAAEIAPFERDLRFLKVAISTAPLLGLLGTVTGMLTTFQALATGYGGQKTMDLVAGGISEALITTQTGLMIALPGFFLHYQLNRQRDHYEALLTHLETTVAQFLRQTARA